MDIYLTWTLSNRAHSDYFKLMKTPKRRHRHQCVSKYPYTGSRKHKFACFPMAAIHIDTSSTRVQVTCEFHSYEQFLCRSCFYPTRM